MNESCYYVVLVTENTTEIEASTQRKKSERLIFHVERKGTFCKLHCPTVFWGWLQSTSTPFSMYTVFKSNYS
jgi:hypothetical protein